MSFGACGGECPADFNDDGVVNGVDLVIFIFNFGPCPDGRCPWDVNGDSTVDLSDLFQVLSNLGPCDGCPEDINGDGVVNGQDVVAVITHFGPGAPAPGLFSVNRFSPPMTRRSRTTIR